MKYLLLIFGLLFSQIGLGTGNAEVYQGDLEKSEPRSMIHLAQGNGHGSSGTKIRRFSTIIKSIGSDIEYRDSATNGASFTIRRAGVYAITYTDFFSTEEYFAISLNASSLSTNATSLAQSERLALIRNVSGRETTVNVTYYLEVGDVIRAHTHGQASGTATASFVITRSN